MGIFHDLVTLVNRTPVNLTVTFDGQEKTLVPGDNAVPEIVVPFAKNQNPIMGSQEPNNPHISGARYLVGVKLANGQALYGDEITPLTKAEWADHLGRPCREDNDAAFQEKYGNDPKARQVVLGKGRKSTAQNRYEATQGVASGDGSGFSGKD